LNQVGHRTGWSPDLTNTRFQTSAQAALKAADVPKLVLKWAFGFPSATSAYSHLTVAGGRVFIGSQEQFYSTKDGSIVWTFDTNRSFETVNGIPANGGSINGPGPAVASGMVFINSGYSAFGGRAGNALLAFAVQKVNWTHDIGPKNVVSSTPKRYRFSGLFGVATGPYPTETSLSILEARMFFRYAGL